MAKKNPPIVSNAQAFRFCSDCLKCNSLSEVAAVARRFAGRIKGSRRKRGSWKYFLLRFADSIETGGIPFSIFAMEGNKKLPFAAFSALPVFTCPGAGSCAGILARGDRPNLRRAHCYSLRAWRYPAALLRQLQNTLLLKFNRRAIIDAFRALPLSIVVRLYVDGDFDSPETAVFWFNLLRQRADIKAYGYSKSWDILLSISAHIPGNYVLNLSNGGIDDSDPAKRAALAALPCCRGEFLALPVKGKFARGFARYSDPAYHRAVRAAAEEAGIGKVFSCPGDCGGCAHGRHACGTKIPGPCGSDVDRFLMPLPIVIGIH